MENALAEIQSRDRKPRIFAQPASWDTARDAHMAGSLTLLLAQGVWAQAGREVTLIAPGGIKAAVEQMIPGFEKKTGIKVVTDTIGLGELEHKEHGVHVNVAWWIPINDRMDIALSVGPSSYAVRQHLAAFRALLVLTVITGLALRANLTSPPQLSPSALWLVIGYLALAVVMSVMLIHRFRVPRT